MVRKVSNFILFDILNCILIETIRLKKRNGIAQQAIIGEPGAVDMEQVAIERVKLNAVLKEFAPRDRFN